MNPLDVFSVAVIKFWDAFVSLMEKLFTENDQEPHLYVILFAVGPAKRRGFLFVGWWAVSGI